MATTKLRPTRAFKQRLEFLQSGNIILKGKLKIITISYRTNEPTCSGLRKFISTKLPPLQYKNPRVQMVLFKNAFHYQFPAIKLYFNDGKCILIDAYKKDPDKILQQINSLAGQTEEELLRFRKAAEYNPANFGDARRGRLCICEVPGQLPCPAKKPVPAKYKEHKWRQKEEE